MDIPRFPEPAVSATARLFVHAGKAVGGVANGGFPPGWLRALYPGGSRGAARAPVRLRITDLQGRDVRAVEDCGRLSVVALPAGTYNVDACIGDRCRRYTLTLREDSAFDLYLNLESGAGVPVDDV